MDNDQERLREEDSDDSTQASDSQPSLNDARREYQRRNVSRQPLRNLTRLKGSGKGGVRGVIRTGQIAARGLAFFATPAGWVVLAILAVLAIIFLFFFLDFDLNKDLTVKLTKSGPEKVDNCPSDVNDLDATKLCLIEYTLNASYTGNPNRLTVTDELDDNVEFVSAEPAGSFQYDQATHTVTWTFGDGGQSSGSSSAAEIGTNLPPNTDTCSGVYSNINDGGQHNGQNFGDPACTLANSPRVPYSFNGKSWSNVPQALIDLLTKLDPNNVGYWIGIISCEAPGFDPNNMTAIAANGSAWGLFQMGARIINGQESPYGPGDGLNGPYDRGDVNWQNQVNNAVKYNTERLNNNWRYWECASLVWGLW